MQFIPLSSGSHGNCYHVISGSGSQLLIDAGLPFKKIQKALNFKVSDIVAVLISHSHQDHAMAVKDFLKAGIDVYMLEATRQELGLKHHRIKIVQPLGMYFVGDFKIMPFDLRHDVENIGFFIQEGLLGHDGEKLLYATDTAYIKYKFRGINIVAVECNYSEDILRQNILAGVVPAKMKKRLERSHFSLENYKDFIKENDMSKVREIWLLHTSNTNSDASLFKREIQMITGIPTYIA